MAKTNRNDLVKLLSLQFRDKRIVTNPEQYKAVEIVKRRHSRRQDGSCVVMLQLESGERIRVTYQAV